MRPVGKTELSIQMLVDGDVATSQRSSPTHPLDLQVEILKAHRVVAVDAALELQGEDQVQVATRTGRKGAAPLAGRNLKTTIELRDVLVAQEAVGLLDRVNAT
ncbi:MAG TPA: hypothetical protein VEC95_05305 [Terriglobales bacterium]|nr:hypothetical protein [Terriglobales bacterium]